MLSRMSSNALWASFLIAQLLIFNLNLLGDKERMKTIVVILLSYLRSILSVKIHEKAKETTY